MSYKCIMALVYCLMERTKQVREGSLNMESLTSHLIKLCQCAQLVRALGVYLHTIEAGY